MQFHTLSLALGSDGLSVDTPVALTKVSLGTELDWLQAVRGNV